MSNIKHLEVILKTVERCNINCTYCYFFNGIDQSYLKHPPYIKINTIEKSANFLRDACKELGIKSVRIDFHGGEPLMQKISDFERMCEIFYKAITPYARLDLAVQTNGMLINDKWLDVFEKYHVAVGVSLDGTKEYNDLYRVDKKGRSTYDKVIQGLNLLNQRAERSQFLKPGVLCVINTEYNAKKIYRHFVHDLKLENIDFLIPDITVDAARDFQINKLAKNSEAVFNTPHPIPPPRKRGEGELDVDTRNTTNSEATYRDNTYLKPYKGINNFDGTHYGVWLCDVFEEWIQDDNPLIRIRILNSIMSLMAGGKSYIDGIGENTQDFVAFTIASNGDLAPDDTFRSANPDFMNTGLNVENAKLSEFLLHPTMQLLNSAEKEIPEECTKCRWKKICRGGTLINRYSNQHQFKLKSVMCEGLKLIYQRVNEYLIQNGVEVLLVEKKNYV